jgi:HPt (histidine-containing phosphotransfer) domain-containing protein
MSVEEIKKYLSEHFHLPVDQVETMMPSFLSTLGMHMENLEEALNKNNLMQVGKAGHTIKGAFLNLGLNECARIARDIEEYGKAEDPAIDYRSKIDLLHHHLKDILQ